MRAAALPIGQPASCSSTKLSTVTRSLRVVTPCFPQVGRREARMPDRFAADGRRGAGSGGFPPLLGGNFTRILTGKVASIPRGRIPPFFEGDSGKGMMSPVSHEGQVNRRPHHLAGARMFWPHLGHSNWNSFIVENGSSTRLDWSSSGRPSPDVAPRGATRPPTPGAAANRTGLDPRGRRGSGRGRQR